MNLIDDFRNLIQRREGEASDALEDVALLTNLLTEYKRLLTPTYDDTQPLSVAQILMRMNVGSTVFVPAIRHANHLVKNAACGLKTARNGIWRTQFKSSEPQGTYVIRER